MNTTNVLIVVIASFIELGLAIVVGKKLDGESQTMPYSKHKLIIRKTEYGRYQVLEVGNPDTTSNRIHGGEMTNLHAARTCAKRISRELGIPFAIVRAKKKKVSERAKQIVAEQSKRFGSQDEFPSSIQ